MTASTLKPPVPAAAPHAPTPPWWAQLAHRVIGDWPWWGGGAIPLSRAAFRALFDVHPALADYLPFVDYDPHDQVFLLNDGISVGAVFRLGAADLDGRSPERRAEFNAQLDHALCRLPAEDDRYPYLVQLYLEDRQPTNIADTLADALPASVRETPFSQTWLETLRAHFEAMRAPQGIFDDERVRQSGDRAKGWRAIERQIHLCVYRKAPASAWKTRRYRPGEQLTHAFAPFLNALEALGVSVQRLDDAGLRAWLLPWLTPVVAGYASPEDYLAAQPLPPRERRGPAWDLGAHMLQLPPQPIPDRDDDRDRGVWRFGSTYTRYLTFQGVEFAPDDGALTTDRQVGADVRACVWDRMPARSVLAVTIVPWPAERIDQELDKLQLFVDKTTSDGAAAAREELAVAKAARRQHQRIYRVQMGLYLRAPDRETLENHTLQVSNVLAETGLRPIPARYDLIADDSFVRNLPMVYDARFDRRHALRARLTYSSHLAALLPLYGRGVGTTNPCYVMYRRDGQVFTCNPHRDRLRVAHTVLFGPTGSGKSATAIALALQSMAVNRPRQVIIEKGHSFGLLMDYYERLGLTVRRIVFTRDLDVCYPPYADTEEALAEHQGGPGMEDEQRSYLAEMLYRTELMVTGGRAAEIEALTRSDRAALQTGLLRALENSRAADRPHARPTDVYRALKAMAEEEPIPEIRLSIRRMADALQMWTAGPRGHFFNRYGQGFADDDDVVHIDLGLLTTAGNEDMLALTVLSLLAHITGWAERHQASGRPIEVWFDEGHYISKTPLTVKGFIVGTKVWRKLHTWLMFATQDFSDFSADARQILSQAEWWILLSMGPAEARQVSQFRDLSAEEQRLLTQALKEPGRFVEGVLLSEKLPPALLRFVPPPLALALAQTEGEEKNRRLQLMREHNLSELDAALRIAQDIADQRARRRAPETPL
ncbi:MAG TPA: conjugative transfer ATPase [Candidatus Competibacter sp.]|nr:conjugative transfer ATPase [Candidatus Competibacter sp.]